ncbi:MAG: CocE/NonD family hydrolase, partial [Acidobacteriota bacterium]
MKVRSNRLLVLAAVLLIPCLSFGQTSLREPSANDDFVVRDVMIPMRDGVQLFTVILTPKQIDRPLPILLERTPYDASRIVGGTSTQLKVMMGPKYVGGGYIFIAQDIRGRFKSEGEYHMYRVPRGAYNQTETDETTDAWDTIDWLVKNIPDNNGKVGVWGTSYPGWLTLAAERDPHPALAAAVPFNPVVDVWKADDWFHWGAFRASYAFEFIYNMETKKGARSSYPYEKRDLYDWMLGQGSVAGFIGSRLDERHEMWTRIVENPSYTQYWKDCAADQWFDSPSRLVPTLHVHGFWDQEDIYGSPAVYEAMEQLDADNDLNFFAAGPWYHGQHFSNGSHLGAIGFDEDTALRFRDEVLEPFLSRFLKGEQVDLPAPVTAFETGSNRWRRFDNWPPKSETRKLYLQSGGRLSFEPPLESEAITGYVSDPAKPVPAAPRPFLGYNYSNSSVIARWQRWLVEDQRFVDGRPDVATWVSEPLEEDLTVRGGVIAKLFAETTGTDADWVVKFIDVYPDQYSG